MVDLCYSGIITPGAVVLETFGQRNKELRVKMRFIPPGIEAAFEKEYRRENDAGNNGRLDKRRRNPVRDFQPWQPAGDL